MTTKFVSNKLIIRLQYGIILEYRRIIDNKKPFEFSLSLLIVTVTMSSKNCDRHVIIIGGGLVGSLAANFMAKRNYQVSLYEYRDDIRVNRQTKGRSINLALSHRGRRALASVGLESVILENSVPMQGRLIHEPSGRTRIIKYNSYRNQCIYSVGRNFLNRTILEALKNVDIYFNYKLVNVDLDEGSVTFINTNTKIMKTCTADLIIGADGAFSTLRKSIQQRPLFDYHQTYIDHGYLELTIPKENGDRIRSNHLHIWPRRQFMMIALPNLDKSWTITLFMPYRQFEQLTNNDDELIEFFRVTFPDALQLIGVDELIEDFHRNRPSPLISIKCNRYHYGSRFLLIGDAAHTIVPFYGQGVNAGFEDCLIFDRILERNFGDFEESISEFTRIRCDDAYAICDLAFYNYIEMRDLVIRRSFLYRRFLDEFLYKFFPNRWVPLYNAVTFTDINYRKCIEIRQWQDKLLWRLFCLITAFIAILIASWAF